MVDPLTTPRPSAITAASEAVELVRLRLFPFRLERWLALGVVAFLDSCGRGQGGVQFPGGGPGGTGTGGDGGPSADSIGDWVSSHLPLVVGVALAVLVFVVLLVALVTFLQSRGTFMYLDDVATGRADIARPWREHSAHARSYFTWVFGTALVTLCGVLLLLVPAGLLVWTLIQGGARPAPITGLIALVLLLIGFVILVNLFLLLLRSFAAPLQLILGVPCGAALGVAWTFVKRNKGAVAAYVLLKIVFTLMAALVALIAGCATCCIGFLPVISHTLLQPLLYFERAWSLFLLRQGGYDLFAAMTPPATPPPPPPLPLQPEVP